MKHARFYLSGCLQGDACITGGQRKSPRGYLRLRCKDVDFAVAFRDAILAAFQRRTAVECGTDGYYDVRSYNGHGRFDALRTLRPTYHEEKEAWLRGLFDSEGNALCIRHPSQGPRSWERRVSIFSTNLVTLETARAFLDDLGIPCRLRRWHCGTGHLGTKPVHALLLNAGRDHFALFAARVGSSIERKRRTLELIPQTYVERS